MRVRVQRPSRPCFYVFLGSDQRCLTYTCALRLPTPALFPRCVSSEHVASVKDLKRRVITPAKDAGTPQKGLLKVGGGGGSGVKPMKPTAGRKDTPYVSKKKKASDFF